MYVYTRYIFVGRVGPYLSLLLTLSLSHAHASLYSALVSLRKWYQVHTHDISNHIYMFKYMDPQLSRLFLAVPFKRESQCDKRHFYYFVIVIVIVWWQ